MSAQLPTFIYLDEFFSVVKKSISGWLLCGWDRSSFSPLRCLFGTQQIFYLQNRRPKSYWRSQKSHSTRMVFSQCVGSGMRFLSQSVILAASLLSTIYIYIYEFEYDLYHYLFSTLSTKISIIRTLSESNN